MNEVICGCGENHGLTPIKPGDYDYRCFCGAEWKLIISDEPPYPPLPKIGPSAQEQIEALTRRVEVLERRLARVEENQEDDDYGTCARCGDPIKDPDCSPILCGSCFASGA